MTRSSKKDLEQIKTTLEDNAADITVHELFDRVINDWKLTNLFPHDNPEQGDKDLLEKIYVEYLMKDLSKLSKEELIALFGGDFDDVLKRDDDAKECKEVYVNDVREKLDTFFTDGYELGQPSYLDKLNSIF